MSDIETTIEAADERPGRGRRKGQGDSKPRRSAGLSARNIIKAAGAAGFNRLTIDSDGKITVEKGIPAADADGAKGEQSEWSNLHKLADDE